MSNLQRDYLIRLLRSKRELMVVAQVLYDRGMRVAYCVGPMSIIPVDASLVVPFGVAEEVMRELRSVS